MRVTTLLPHSADGETNSPQLPPTCTVPNTPTLENSDRAHLQDQRAFSLPSEARCLEMAVSCPASSNAGSFTLVNWQEMSWYNHWHATYFLEGAVWSQFKMGTMLKNKNKMGTPKDQKHSTWPVRDRLRKWWHSSGEYYAAIQMDKRLPWWSRG